jgi:hypothetical protein
MGHINKRKYPMGWDAIEQACYFLSIVILALTVGKIPSIIIKIELGIGEKCHCTTISI